LRKLLRITLPSVVVFLLLLEIALRLGGVVYGYVRHPQGHSAASAVKSNTTTILCLGDSFTEGNGATAENSYPAQLERLLQGKGYEHARVFNEGRGGMTSSLLLSQIEGYLATYRPQAVLILVGCNNTWNLEKSSYFILADHSPGLLRKLERILSASKVYKLCKISWVNLQAKFRGLGQAEADMPLAGCGNTKERLTMGSIRPASRALFYQGLSAYAQGDYDSSMRKFHGALTADNKNYMAHLWLSHVYKSIGDAGSARQHIRQAVALVDGIDAWQYLIYEVVNRLRLLGGSNELRSLKAYLQDRYGQEQARPLVGIIDGAIRLSTDQEVFRRVLEYDLARIISTAKREGVAVLLQTYPRGLASNTAIRAFAKTQGAPLVDHQEFFENKIPAAEMENFFVSDGHCNAHGYQIMAARVYDALVAEHVLAAKN